MTDKPMSQEEIDALLSGLSGDAPPAPAAQPGSAAPAGGAGQPGAGQPVVDQSELDALLGAFAEPAQSAGPVDQAELDRLLDSLDTGSGSEALEAAVAPATTPSGPLGQDDIDQILAGLGGSTPAAAPGPAPATAPAPTAGPMGQDDIDSLLNALSSEPPPAAAPAKAPAAAAGPMGQDDIDSLLNALSTEPAPAASATLDAPLPPPKPFAPAPVPVGKLDQSGIDDLLAQLGAPEAAGIGAAKLGDSKAALPGVGGTSRGAMSRGTLALSTEDLTALVSKHAAPAAPGESEGMIDQGDIDALVKQLGAATGTVEAAPEKPASMSQELAKHDAAIDQLLGEAHGGGAAANAATMDAIDMRSVLDKPPSTSAAHRTPSPFTVNVPVLTPPELRGARWLLAAAVLLLAVCAGTLVVVAGAVRTLGSELAREREAGLEPGDDYGDDYAAASARLSSPDDEQVAKGVLFLERLKKRYPSHAGEVSLALARHFAGHGAWREAAREYGEVLDGTVMNDDPRVLLENAEALRQLGDRAAAKRQLYALLADEARWTGESNPPRPASIADRNRQALVAAHLLLGRLLDGAPDERLAVGAPPAEADAETHAKPDGHGAPHAEAHAEAHH